MAYSLVEFAQSLKPENCKIQNIPDLIFLCGGRVAKEGDFRSARDFFYRYLLSEDSAWGGRIKLAEEISAWFQKDDAFPDLLQLENYLAALAAATVLFVESPGSIAELGAFAASEALRPKTLAILNNFYGDDRSFIADGPVRRIEGQNDKHVLYYDWDPRELNSDATKKEFTELAQNLTALLKEEDAEQKQQLTFKSGEIGHTLLLVADLIRFTGAATKSDLADALDTLGCQSAREDLDHHLSILQSVSLVEKHRRGNQIFYARNSKIEFVRYAYREEAISKDTDRNQALVQESLDNVRKAIYRKVLGKESNV